MTGWRQRQFFVVEKLINGNLASSGTRFGEHFSLKCVTNVLVSLHQRSSQFCVGKNDRTAFTIFFPENV
jgi:hypothetical protein